MDRRTIKPIRLKSMGRRHVSDMLEALERKSAFGPGAPSAPRMWTQEFLASGKPGKAPG